MKLHKIADQPNINVADQPNIKVASQSNIKVEDQSNITYQMSAIYWMRRLAITLWADESFWLMYFRMIIAHLIYDV